MHDVVPECSPDFASWTWSPSKDRFVYADTGAANWLRPQSFTQLLSWVHVNDRENLSSMWTAEVSKPGNAQSEEQQAFDSEQRPLRHEFRVQDSAGQFHWVELHARAKRTFDGAEICVVGISCDFTKRKQLQQNQLRRMKELESFAATAAHDLKEPLRTVKSYCHLLEEEIAGKLTASERREFETITHATERMQALLNSIIAYSGLGPTDLGSIGLGSLGFARRSECREFDSKEAIEAAWANLTTLVNDRGATLKMSGRFPVVHGEFQQIVQLAQNVLANSIQAYAPGQPAVVEVFAHDGPVQQIKIQDQGRGVSADELERLKQPFKRGADADYAGSGLGLAICDRLAKHNAIDLQFESPPAGGVAVTLAFRCKLSEAVA